MINRLILAIKAAGLNHKQINTILVSVAPDISASEDTAYPLLRIWPDGFRLDTQNPRNTVYRFAIAVADIHRSDWTDAIEGLSDTAQIIHDIHASLKYMYTGQGIQWVISDDCTAFMDGETDIICGHAVTLECVVPYNSNFCWVPSNDYAFPNMNMDLIGISDGGDANYELVLEIEDGGGANDV